jgi:nitric oxide synthase oxygenase domain/subunit
MISRWQLQPTAFAAACCLLQFAGPRVMPLLLLQCDCHLLPQVFEIPEQYKVQVPIRHPTNEAFAALQLEWYAVPAVSNIELSVGGILYTAAPFNGW